MTSLKLDKPLSARDKFKSAILALNLDANGTFGAMEAFDASQKQGQ